MAGSPPPIRERITRFDEKGSTGHVSKVWHSFFLDLVKDIHGYTSHASDHITGGADEVDGDKLDIDWNPSTYTPSTSPSEASSVDHLTAHLKGIDTVLALIGSHASDHITGGADEIDGDKLDIDWTPTNYTPSTSPTEADNADNLTAHLKGVDSYLISVSQATSAFDGHKDRHDPEDGADALDCAAAGEIVGVAAAAEGSAHSFARSDHTHQVQHAITDNHIVTIDGTANQNEHAVFGAGGIAGLTDAELLAALSGDAAAAFDWNTQNLTGLGTLASAAGTLTIDETAALSDYATNAEFDSHKDRHDPEDGADPLDCAAAGTISPDDSAAEGSAHSLARSDHTHQITCSSPGSILPDASATEGTASTFARSDHVHTITCSDPEALSAVQAGSEGAADTFARSDHRHAIAHAITDNSIVTVDDADAAANDYAKFTAGGLAGRSYSEVLADLSGQAAAAFDMNTQNITNVGTVDGVDVSGHASRHITGGSDEIDGDKVDIDWNPTTYTPSTSPAEADNVDNLTAHLKGIDSKLAAVGGGGNCSIKTGTYTGDGSTDQGITGVGFTPKYVVIWPHYTTVTLTSFFERTDTFDTEYAGIHVGAGAHYIQGNLLISLDADGFSVDDGGTNAHPNTYLQVYDYLALG